MKGIKIVHNNRTIKATLANNGMMTVHIYHMEKENRVYIGSVDYAEYEKIVWYNSSPLTLGDSFEIEVAEIEESSTPASKEKDNTIKRPKTKLEYFRWLENELKKQGLV